jgi:thioesterase superfamily protein 4
MDDASSSRLESIPWVARLIKDPKWTRTPTGSRLPKASSEDSFFAETLATDRTIRSCLTLRTTEEADDDLPYQEIVTVVELGDGLNGYPKVCHGGMLATLLDEVCGVLITSNTAKVAERAEQPLEMSYMTACKFAMRS